MIDSDLKSPLMIYRGYSTFYHVVHIGCTCLFTFNFGFLFYFYPEDACAYLMPYAVKSQPGKIKTKKKDLIQTG